MLFQVVMSLCFFFPAAPISLFRKSHFAGSFGEAVVRSTHERKLGKWLLSGKGCFGSRLEHLYSSVGPEGLSFPQALN